MSSPLATGLGGLLKVKPDPQNIVNVLQTLEQDLEKQDLSNAPLPFISGCIHRLYTLPLPLTAKGSMIRIMLELELSAKQSIVEQYKFDKLIAASLDARPSDPPPEVDDEKISAFRFISCMIKFRHHIPVSLIRALLSLYQTPKQTYGPLIVALIGEIGLYEQELQYVPEAAHLIVTTLAETGNPTYASLINYYIENNMPFVKQNQFISHLISPITAFARNPESDLTPTINAIVAVLEQWPGLISFGIQGGLLEDLVRCLPHEPCAVISIFQALIKLSGPAGINDGYTGLALNALLKFGLIDKLKEAALTSPEASAYLANLLPYVRNDESSGVDITRSTIASSGRTVTQSSQSPVFRISAHQPKSPVTTCIGYALPQAPDQWDWEMIIIFLTVIFPHSYSEASSKDAQQMISKLITFFSSTFLAGPYHKLQETTLHCFFDFMLHQDWGITILEKATQFKTVFMLTLKRLSAESKPEIFAMFRILISLMTDNNGQKLIEKWGLTEPILTLGENSTNPELLRSLRLSSMTVDLFLRFLNKSTHLEALEVLKKLASEDSADFADIGFAKIMIPHIIRSAASGDSEKLSAALNCACQMLQNDDRCLLIAAKDQSFHDILKRYSKPIYALLFGKESALSVGNVKEEIDWWMESGNKKYVKIVDASARAGFTGEQPAKFPEITLRDGIAQVPPHLFASLSRHQQGIDLLKDYIPQLTERLDHKKESERRAALYAIARFGSNPATHEILKSAGTFDAIDKLLNGSYVQKGSLIQALSLIAQSPIFAADIVKRNWQLYTFGEHSAIIPYDVVRYFPKEEPIPIPLAELPPDLPEFAKFTLLIRQCASPISQKKAKDDLRAIFKTSMKDMAHPDLANYAHELISRFMFNPDTRLFMQIFFKSVPLLPIPREAPPPETA